MSVWNRVTLESISESVDYGVTASATNVENGPKFLRITDIQDDRVDWATVPWCKCDERALRSSQLRPGDIVFARTGATTGKSYLVNYCPSEAVFASYLIRVRLNENVEPRYVSHFFKTNDYWAQISQGARGAAQPGVNSTTLKSLEIPLPSLAEQRRIATILDKVDALRAKRRESLAQLDRLAQAIFVEMFGDLFLNSKNFPVFRLGDACDVRDGTHDSPTFISEGYPLVTSKNLKNGCIDLSDVGYISESDYMSINKRSKVDKGDLLMPMIGTIGNPVLVREAPNFAIKNMALIKFTEKSPSRLFVHQFLNGDCFDRLVANRNKGGTQKFLALGEIRGLPLPIPPLSLQSEFDRRIERLSDLKECLGVAMTETGLLYDSLQNQAFKGKR